jgi:PAS domain S-box-containing protein
MTSSEAENSILDAAIDAVVGMDQDGKITEFNAAAETMFGRLRSEVMGELLADVIVPASQRAAHHDGLARYLATRQAHILGKRVEISALRADGTAFPVELAITCAESNGVHRFTGFIRDISERRESEQALRASEERFRLLVHSVKDYAIFMLDHEGRVATWNAGAQACKGYAPHEILGQHFSTFYTALDQSAGKPARELEVATRVGRVENEGWRVRKDGSEFWADVLITAIRDNAGELVGFAKVTRDLTERRNAADRAGRKRLEELQARGKSMELELENRRMHEANRLKSEFLANMSHELRTPLNAIIGFSELMFKGKVGAVSDEHKEYLGDILNSSRHLLKLINDVLDLAKVESGKMEFVAESVDIGEVVVEVCDILRGIASAKRIRIQTEIESGFPPARLDPSKLKQVLYNYLSNALKFTPEDGLVTIRVTSEGRDCVRIEVEDTGIGIRPEDTHRLFIEFQQLDAGMAKKYAGTGLGLALTKRIVEAQGGSVGLRSEPGKGAAFWAVFPRIDGAGGAALSGVPNAG